MIELVGGANMVDYHELLAKMHSGEISRAEFEKWTEGQKDYLISLMNQLLVGRMCFAEFDRLYDDFVLDMPWGLISEQDWEFFEMVREKLESVCDAERAQKEDPEVMSSPKFVEWLAQQKRLYEERQS